MKISFVAGFGPIVRDMAQSRAFWEQGPPWMHKPPTA